MDQNQEGLPAIGRYCTLSKNALENKQIGFMFRDTPLPEYDDSGWLFLEAEDELKQIAADPLMARVMTLDDVTAIDPTVTELLESPVGSFFLKADGTWLAAIAQDEDETSYTDDSIQAAL